MGKPAWFDASTYNWSPHMGHHYDPWSQEAQSKVGQQWYRDPKWGGHVIWNPDYGFQDLRSVQDFYIGWDQSKPWKQAFKKAGFQQQHSDVGDWSQYYNDPEHRVVSHQEKMQNQYGNAWGQPWSQPYGQYGQYGGNYDFAPPGEYSPPVPDATPPDTTSRNVTSGMQKRSNTAQAGYAPGSGVNPWAEEAKYYKGTKGFGI